MCLIRFRTWKIYDICFFLFPSFNVLLFTSLKIFLELLSSLLFFQPPLEFKPWLPHSGTLPVICLLRSLSPLVPYLANAICPIFPWSRTWITNSVPVITTAYNPCLPKNSNPVLRVLPLDSQCGMIVSVPKAICLSLAIWLLVPSLILLLYTPEPRFYMGCYSWKIQFYMSIFFSQTTFYLIFRPLFCIPLNSFYYI